ncbi:hypothetical protein VTI28DRAFT_1395 [Corynascus sepedonium]
MRGNQLTGQDQRPTGGRGTGWGRPYGNFKIRLKNWGTLLSSGGKQAKSQVRPARFDPGGAADIGGTQATSPK